MQDDCFVRQSIDDVPIRLKEAFDFGFMNCYGTVFRVLDAQSSGNLCFGVEKAGRRYFVKFAGARTINDHDLSVEDAIARLKAAVPKYRELAHPLLTQLVAFEEAGGGFTFVFDWADHESIGDMNPASHKRFHLLPTAQKTAVFEKVLRFHEHVAKCGYVAIDFNDNSILYNFDNGEVMFCDIDFYAKQSYMNGMGSIFGFKPLMAPEEFRCAGLIDEVTNVYAMGATAFMLLAGYERSWEAWPLDTASYDVVKRATSDLRVHRQQSIEQFVREWKACAVKA